MAFMLIRLSVQDYAKWKPVYDEFGAVRKMNGSKGSRIFSFTSPQGHAFDVDLKPGQAVYLDPVEHTTEIIGTNEAHVVLVELK